MWQEEERLVLSTRHRSAMECSVERKKYRLRHTSFIDARETEYWRS